MQDDRQQAAAERQEDRQDFYEDEWDDHWHGHYYGGGSTFVVGAAVGAATVSALTTLPCSSTAVIVNRTTYYQCNATWYRRGYESNTVVYIVTSPPPGHY